jgi:hypothetical protein
MHHCVPGSISEHGVNYWLSFIVGSISCFSGFSPVFLPGVKNQQFLNRDPDLELILDSFSCWGQLEDDTNIINKY